jgi:sigma-B regulation protein RsbU (phosphoserine phosphatase)
MAAGRSDDLERILAVSRALGAERDLDRLLTLIVAAASDLVGADRTSLFLVDPEDGSLTSRVAQGTGTIRIPAGTGIAGQVAADRTVVNIADAYADPRFNPDHDRRSGYRTTSILCMPLIDHEDRVVGVLQSLNRAAGPFGPAEESLLGALCSQAAVALTNARLVIADRERQRLERDHELARQIQQAAIPPGPWTALGWHVAGDCQPCDETGGDYLDVLVGERHLDLVVADVTGHGLPAAMVMMAARATLRALSRPGIAPTELVGEVNRLLSADLSPETFMSLGLLRLSADGTVESVHAGHEAALVVRRDGTCERLGGEGLLIGIDGDAVYGSGRTRLLPGDVAVLLTDGVAEAQAAPDWRQLGTEAVEAAVRRAAPDGAEAVVAALDDLVVRHLAGRPAHDDITILAVERQG